MRRFAIRAPLTLITFRDKRELSRTEQVSPESVREHVNFLLGRGAQPRPQAQQPTSTQRPIQSSDGKPVTVTDQTFAREVLQANQPVLVDFWAPWCGPCRMIAPALEKIASDYAGRVRVAKLNVDENPRTQAQYQVQGIPTLLLVKNGRVMDRIVGALPEPQLRAQVERLLRA